MHNRRQFLKSVAATTAGLAVSMPAASYARIIGANDRILVNVIGTYGRGLNLARSVADLQGAEVAYISDVDARAVEKGIAAVVSRQERRPVGVEEFRKTLDDPDLDAVAIATPDHWHAAATIAALQAGKHVYVEKPLAHNPREGELMVEAARKYNRVVQMGNQRRSWPNVIDAVAEVQNGTIGEVRYARSWYANRRGPLELGPPGGPIPAGLNYDLWQGPAPRQPYQENLIHYNWHWFWNWGTGESCNNGVHTIDVCRWGLGVDFPSRVTASGGSFYYPEDDWQTPDTQVMTFEFPDGKYIMWEGQSRNASRTHGSTVGTSFHGTEGSIIVTGTGYSVRDPKDNLVKEINAQNGREVHDIDGSLIGLDSIHMFTFLEAVRGKMPPTSPVAEGHKSTLLPQLGNISLRVGRKLTCDPATGHILNDQEAMNLWKREYAPGWEVNV